MRTKKGKENEREDNIPFPCEELSWKPPQKKREREKDLTSEKEIVASKRSRSSSQIGRGYFSFHDSPEGVRSHVPFMRLNRSAAICARGCLFLRNA